jgi:ribosomal protein S18 acetylase RimI-like enzyme
MPKPFAVVTRDLTHPDAALLLAAMTEEISALYGFTGGLRGDWTPAMFTPPEGRFVVGYLGADPVAVGGYRRVEDGLAQVHRVFVLADQRGQGLAARLVTRLEALAAAAGYRTLRLDTGHKQDGAMRLYERLGYERIPRFAPYEDDASVRCYAKRIG